LSIVVRFSYEIKLELAWPLKMAGNVKGLVEGMAIAIGQLGTNAI